MGVDVYKIPRYSKGKLLIPVGWNELSIRKVEERKTSTNKRMVVLTLYKKPAEELYGVPLESKESFQMMKLFHFEGEGSIRTWWHRMSSMPSDDLDMLHTFKGKRFKALIRHTEHLLEKNGTRVEDGRGNEKTYWQAEVVRVAHIKSDVQDVDMNRLVDWIEQPLKNFRTKAMRAIVDAFDLEFHSFVVDKSNYV